MNRTIILLLLFVVLGGAAWFFSQKKETEAKSTVLGWDRQFKVENPEDIHKIFIAQRTGEKPATLKRAGNHWIYNEKYRARPSAVENVLEVLTTVRMHSIPPNAALENIVSELGSQGIKIEVYGKNDEKLKVWYLGGVTVDERATYAIMEGSEQPFVVEIPRMEGSLRPRFELKTDDWRDRAVFRHNINDIQSVSVEYPKLRNKSFKLNRTENGYDVQPFYNISVPINRPVSEGDVEAFLMGFEELIAENFANNFKKQDSVINTIPFAVFKVKDKNGKERQAAIFARESLDKSGMVRSETIERYWAAVSDENTQDFMVVQHRVFEKVLWAYEYLFERPS